MGPDSTPQFVSSSEEKEGFRYQVQWKFVILGSVRHPSVETTRLCSENKFYLPKTMDSHSVQHDWNLLINNIVLNTMHWFDSMGLLIWGLLRIEYTVIAPAEGWMVFQFMYWVGPRRSLLGVTSLKCF